MEDWERETKDVGRTEREGRHECDEEGGVEEARRYGERPSESEIEKSGVERDRQYE